MKTKRSRGKSRANKLGDMFKASTNMSYKDIKRNCVVRGMPFQEVVDSTIPGLSNWLHHNVNNEIKPHLLDDFDDWVENLLRERGSEDLIHPQLRLGFIGEKGDDGEVTKTKRVKGIKKKKKKREKTADGIFKGTKKALTFQLQQDGVSMADAVTQVMEEYPDASEKSIKIWWKKSRRMHAKKD